MICRLTSYRNPTRKRGGSVLRRSIPNAHLSNKMDYLFRCSLASGWEA